VGVVSARFRTRGRRAAFASSVGRGTLSRHAGEQEGRGQEGHADQGRERRDADDEECDDAADAQHIG
jgi:hypothetical protein